MNKIREIKSMAFAGIGTGMGIAVCTLAALDTGISTQTMVSMLAIGMAALGLLVLDRMNEKKSEG